MHGNGRICGEEGVCTAKGGAPGACMVKGGMFGRRDGQ